jgi:uncharacterized protein (TIGR03437 family)
MQCTASSVAPANVRANGRAELVSDLVLTCSGGTPTVLGMSIPQGSFALILDTPLSSRLLGPGWSEALLLVDEPSSGTQVVCATPSSICALQGNGTGVGSYDGTLGRVNVFQGQPASSSEIDFVSIPLDPPGANGMRTFRFTNIRADATPAGATGAIHIQVSALGSTINVNTGQLVANAQTAATFTAKSIQAGPTGITQFAIGVAEKFVNVFRTRTAAPSAGNNISPTPAVQASPGQSIPGSETGFYNPRFSVIAGRGNLGAAGLADSGTRIYVQIDNPGAGITVSAGTLASTTSGGAFRLMTTDATGAGSFAPSGTCCGTVALTPDAMGNLHAVFEVLSANPTAIESVDLPFFVASATGTPAVTTLSVLAGLAPLNNSGADMTSPLPRFTGTTSLTVSASASTAPIQVSTQLLQFSASEGGDSPGPQLVAITTIALTQAAYGIVTDAGTQGSAAPSWLSILRGSGLTPGVLTVSATTGTLPAGALNARIRVVPADPTQTIIDIAVTFTITTAAPMMDVSPRSLSFVSRSGTTGMLEQQLMLRNRGGGSVAFTATILGGATPGGRLGAGLPFLTDVTPSSGQTSPDAPVLLRAHVNPAGLAAGVYSATIHIVSPESTTDIGVTLQIAAAGPILRLSTPALRFLAIAGNPATRSQAVEVIDDGDPNSSVNYTADLLQGSDWLSLLNTQGTAVPGKPGIITLVPGAAVSTFGPGAHYAVLRVRDSNSQNSPQLLTAVLDVSASSTPPFPDPFPAGLVFTPVLTGIPLVSGPSIAVTVSSNTSVSYQASAVTRDGAAWLSLSPATGSTSSSNPAQIQVSVTPAGLPNGVYTGDINISIGAATRVVRVTMLVQPPVLNAVSRAASVCTPAQLVLTDTAFADASVVPAGYPAPLSLLVSDNCGAPLTGASVVTSFDNGDPPLTLLGDGTGAYTGSWVPGRVSSSVTVTFAATDPSFAAPSSTVRIGSVSANALPPPVQSRGGTVKNSQYGPVLGGALAPGTVASVYGSGLATLTSVTTAPPLPVNYQGTQVLVGGIDAPIYFVSPSQLNIQIPFELAPNQQYPVLAFFNNVPTVPDTIGVAAAAPGLLALPDGSLVAQHPDFSLVSSTSPAKPGEALVIYLVGMGSVNQPLASGQGSPSNPLATVSLAPTVTLDGETVVPFFVGLTPGFVGLYQMNFIVPADARTGTLNLTVTQGNLSANVTTLNISQ